jgi:hypothetical protein
MGNGQGGAFVWDNGSMKGARAAILGNGAFAVENVRSCAEQGASKVYIITRRKSLLCPRMPCWFCHMAPEPIPAGFLLDIFKPMYDCAKIDDPWSFYAVQASANKKDVTIKQASRFGIGDVSFLLHAYGLFEYRVDTLQRCSYKTMHLTSGEKLENMDHICKALGLLGDPRVDKMHGITHRLGNMINGDWRRVITADATGMDAKRFTTFSAGPGAASFAKQWYYLHNQPAAMRELLSNPDFKTLMPVHKMSETQPDNTAYMTNVQYEMYAGTVFFNLLPTWAKQEMMYVGGDENSYKYCLLNTMHPVEKMLEYSKADWNRYQDLIREHNGYGDHAWVEYPYTMDMVKQWYTDYNTNKSLNCQIIPEGPNQAFADTTIGLFQYGQRAIEMNMIPRLIREAKLFPGAAPEEDPRREALTCAIFKAKKDLTSSSSDSAMDFDDTQCEAWKDLVSGDYTFKSEELPCPSRSILQNDEAWGKIGTFLAGKL